MPESLFPASPITSDEAAPVARGARPTSLEENNDPAAAAAAAAAADCACSSRA